MQIVNGRFRSSLIFVVLFIATITPCSLHAGPVVIGGDDLDYHGAWSGSANIKGWIYIENALRGMFLPPPASCITRPNDGTIAAIGAPASGASATAGSATGGAAGAISHAAGALNPVRVVNYYEGAAAINTFFTGLVSGTNRPAVIYIPSSYANGGMSLAESNALNSTANIAALVQFVNQGGGLLAHVDDSLGTPPLWVSSLLPGIVMTLGTCSYSNSTLTSDGVTLLTAATLPIVSTYGPCHINFSGNFNGLHSLVLDGNGRPYVIGGGCVLIGDLADWTATRVCQGVATVFTNLSSNATSFLWNFGDGTTSTVQNPTHLYASPGTYTVTLTINGGTSTKTATVVVNPLPPPAVITGPTTTCESPATYCVNPSAGATQTWLATGGTVVPNTGACVIVNWTAGAPSHSLTVTSTNAAGCSRRTTLKVEECCKSGTCCEGLNLDGTFNSFVNKGNSVYGVTQTLSASPGKVTRVRATVTSASVNANPPGCSTSGAANAYITGGASVSGFLPPYLSVPFSREIVWDVSNVGVALSPTAFSFDLKLPPAPGSFFCSDEVSFCVRYDFTVEQSVFGGTTCRTCSISRCYGPFWRGNIIWWIDEPRIAYAGLPLLPSPRVRLGDMFSDGAVPNDVDGTLTIGIKPGTGAPGAELLGTLTVHTQDGEARFDDVSIDTPGTGYVLVVSGGDLEPAESSPFDVLARPPQ